MDAHLEHLQGSQEKELEESLLAYWSLVANRYQQSVLEE